MRRSLRKIDAREVSQYHESEQLFTVTSLEEARERLRAQGLDPANYCFFTWMREGVRYYRVWEDKKLKEGIVKPVPLGQVAARLKRADAEKLYTVAKRYQPGQTDLRFQVGDGSIKVLRASTGEVLAHLSLPIVGGDLIFAEEEVDPAKAWKPQQIAHFLNVILVRGQPADRAFQEADALQV